MEQELLSAGSHLDSQENVKNCIVPTTMSSVLLQTTNTITRSYENLVKLNGNTTVENDICESEDSSESDALIIDDNILKTPVKKQKRFIASRYSKKTDREAHILTHSNPFFNESLFELTQQHQNFQDEVSIKKSSSIKVHNCKSQKHQREKIKSPKCEYAQYLGLQPTVQFKCSKCGQTGFETLTDLNNHIVQCDAISVVEQISQECTHGFKLKRKVFLCSACGTYYENWNLYLHMLERHRRFICLYCLGMFSAPSDLCHHIQTRHNLQPGYKNSLDEFFNVYNEPCYVVCCECKMLFSEEDNFFYHTCIAHGSLNNIATNQKESCKNKTRFPIRPENHITGDFVTSRIGHLQHFEKSLQDGEKKMNNKLLNEHNSEDVLVQEKENRNSSENIITNDKINNQSTLTKCYNIETAEKQSMLENMISKATTLDRQFTTTRDQNCPDKHILRMQTKIEETVDSLNFTVLNEVVNKSSRSLESKDCSQVQMDIETNSIKELANFEGDNAIDSCNYLDNRQCDEGLVSICQDNANDERKEIEDCSYDTDALVNTIKSRSDETDNITLLEEYKGSSSGKPQCNMQIMEHTICSADNIEPLEVRRVPKLSLKLPKAKNEDTSNTMNYDNHMLSEINQNMTTTNVTLPSEVKTQTGNGASLQVAGPEVNIVELKLEQPLDKFDLRVLLQKCLKATAPFCIYCNHARKVAVNGKQLALHAVAEHRFSAVVDSITAEELIPETFVMHIKENLSELEHTFFSLESTNTDEGVTFSHSFECFQCRYSTMVHKELYLHNRKLHTKNLLLCIMCKSNFYSYSELICHLCPGLYILNYDIQFRCCMCISDNLPSAFRLMVHLRKRHHVCDVCLEICNNQYRLSNHVWKHKLHHFCYRCGIAYRNKPDITRHLFWKHGTESVVCKKCLQKKWPHVYHFCVPASSFLCEECNMIFTRAVSLKVHKRIHSNDKLHKCTIDNCNESFISKKLLLKHEIKHKEPEEKLKDEVEITHTDNETVQVDSALEEIKSDFQEVAVEEKIEEKPKLKLDVYDLPELNLSESDSDSDSAVLNDKNYNAENLDNSNVKIAKENMMKHINENNIFTNPLDKPKNMVTNIDENNVVTNPIDKPLSIGLDTSEKMPQILQNIWDNFKNYQAKKEKIDHFFTEKVEDNSASMLKIENGDFITQVEDMSSTSDVALLDHDYCFIPELNIDGNIIEVKPDHTQREDHDYCPPKEQSLSVTKLDECTENTNFYKKKSSESNSSNSSSDSNTTSCTCASNCSCTSSSGSSSSSSDSSDSESSTEPGSKKKIKLSQIERNLRANESSIMLNENTKTVITEIPIQESDLDTTESETDEDFYDEQPQKFARKILEEKRNQFLTDTDLASSSLWFDTSRPSTPKVSEIKTRKKVKSKKKRKHRNEKKGQNQSNPQSEVSKTQFQCDQQPLVVSPITLTILRNSPLSLKPVTTSSSKVYSKLHQPSKSDDFHLRASKRRRVPNKFYGYSSDEELEKGSSNSFSKWRKIETDQPSQLPQTVPPLTIKTPQPVESLAIKSINQLCEVRASSPSVVPPKTLTLRPQPFSVIPVRNHSEQEHSGSDSNDSYLEDKTSLKPPQPQLYCYCRCPYDEVSEMIGCDASDCAIEWFHFECVGIMVPPKGQWFCPDCRKKKQRRESVQT